jgi:hypothetical protein
MRPSRHAFTGTGPLRFSSPRPTTQSGRSPRASPSNRPVRCLRLSSDCIRCIGAWFQRVSLPRLSLSFVSPPSLNHCQRRQADIQQSLTGAAHQATLLYLPSKHSPMQQHPERMRRIAELCAALQAALDNAHAVRETAEALSREAAELARIVPPERRAAPRPAQRRPRAS